MRKQKHITAEYDRWSEHFALRGVPCTERYVDVINMAAQCFQKELLEKHLSENPQADKSVKVIGDAWKACEYVVDFTQSADRLPWTCGHMRSICANSTYFVFQRNRVLLPKEHLMLLGWRCDVDVTALSDAATRDLAGESMGSPCVCACMAALSLSLTGIWG